MPCPAMLPSKDWPNGPSVQADGALTVALGNIGAARPSAAPGPAQLGGTDNGPTMFACPS